MHLVSSSAFCDCHAVIVMLCACSGESACDVWFRGVSNLPRAIGYGCTVLSTECRLQAMMHSSSTRTCVLRHECPVRVDALVRSTERQEPTHNP